MWRATSTPTKSTAPATATPVKHADGSDSDEGWALRADLELCGSVPPPAYAELNTDAHLNTFDVGENGHAVLLGDSGRLFLLNLFQPPSTKKDSVSQPQSAVQNAVRLVHLELDPPLPKHEVREVEAIRINAASTSVLLVARSWVKVVRIPSEATQLLTRSANATSKMATADAKRTMLGANRSNRQHFLVRYEDSTTETVSVDVSANGAAVSRQQVEKKLTATRGKKIASISREVYCASIRQIGYFNRVCHAAWHPLSDSHVVVLSDGEVLSVFNLLQDVTKPEQRHLLDFRGVATGSNSKQSATSSSSVSFCFGSAQRLWDIFTCYILRTDGSIYALCPLVPYDARVHESVLETLKSEVEGQLLLCRKKAKEEQAVLGSASAFHTQDKSATKSSAAAAAAASLTAVVAELKSHKYWLEEAWGPAPAQTPTTGASKKADDASNAQYFRHLRPHVSGISPDTWPLAIQGPVDVTPNSVIAGKNNLPGGSAASSILAVPYTLKAGADTATLSPFLLRAFTSGHVELILLDSSIRPKWKGDAHANPNGATTSRLPALLLECLNLGVDDSGGRAVLERDANDPRLVYCFHSTGVHVLNVSWVFALVAGKDFASLPKSSVRHIFSVSPTAAPANTAHATNVIGARVLKNVYVGHLLLLRLASGNFEVVNVSAASSELLKGVLESNDVGSPLPAAASSLPETLASRVAASAKKVGSHATTKPDSGIKPFADLAVDKLEALNARGIRVTGATKLRDVHDEMLAFVIDRIKFLHDDVEYVDVMDQLIKDRLRLHCEMVKAQHDKAAAVQQSVAQAQASLQALLAKVDKAMLAQQNLRKRAAAVLQAIKENQPMLSRAERAYKEELELLAVEVRRMKPRVAQLTVSGQRVVHALEASGRSAAAPPPPALSEDKKKMCLDVLRAESQLIDDAKALLQDMATNLEQLRK